MKKQTILNLMLLVLPLAVVVLAVNPNSVTVIRDTEILYTNFAEAVYGSVVGWCPPVALLLTYAMFGLVVLYLVTKKPLWIKLVKGASFVAACLAACPIIIPAEVRVIPSVFVGILLMVMWGVTHFVKADPEKKKEESKGRRLSGK